MLGQHLLFQSSTTQVPIALSSGEAEFYSLVKCASRMIGLQSLYRDLGWQLQLRLSTDSTAAKGICSRRGAGKVRHLETPLLWVQRALEEKRFSLYKVDGKNNPADLGTKHMDATTMQRHLARMNIHVLQGASKLALKAAV